MLETIARLEAEIREYVFTDQKSVEAFKSQYAGKKGAINALFAEFRNVPPEQKGALGQALNRLKGLADERLAEATQQLEAQREDASLPDISLPAAPHWQGSRHPLSLVQRRITEVFQRIGFKVEEGPEIEDDWHNFTALNFPPDHPARDMQDTFFTRHPRHSAPFLLRTHTSNVQVRVMESRKPPIRILAPGRVYRNETVTARSHCFFHQIEGLHVEEGVSFRDMKQTLHYFARSIFGPDTRIRLRPSYFPFTEISAEMDVSCRICNGTGCNVCKHTGWVEVLGCGMVDPAVLENCGIDPERYTGYAFGIGIERTAMGLYRIPDLRLFSQNDIRFLRQFVNSH
jgi:phenylalanyl-tRNA synthetase alpha chain